MREVLRNMDGLEGAFVAFTMITHLPVDDIRLFKSWLEEIL